MDWIEISEIDSIENIKAKSFSKPQVIFKHSTRCSISSVAKNRLEKTPTLPDADFYYLDLIKHKNISNSIAEVFQVHHESPQVLLIKNGECTYDESHYAIDMNEIIEQSQAI